MAEFDSPFLVNLVAAFQVGVLPGCCAGCSCVGAAAGFGKCAAHIGSGRAVPKQQPPWYRRPARRTLCRCTW